MSSPAAYERAKRFAASPDAAERAALARQPDLAPEILYFLAGDQAQQVRQAVAANAATPPQADRLLARDMDPGVRAVLGRKLAALSPGLSPESQDRLQQMGWETLCLLVADTATTVRAAIADALAEMPEAPRDLILTLARDLEMPVAEPVICLSPLLTEEDLLALVSEPPVAATVTAVARRPALSEALSEAILAHADSATVTALLHNQSAAIREATLDALIARAACHSEWHAPLVQRPRLSASAVRALGEIVATQLLGQLAMRADLPPGLAEELRQRLSCRLAEPGPPPCPEQALLSAAAHSDRAAMLRLLAEGAGLEEAVVRRAVTLRSPKALCSLCWKAGFSTACLLPVQAVLGQVPPGQALAPQPGGLWPLAPDEMHWQLELLGSMEA